MRKNAHKFLRTVGVFCMLLLIILLAGCAKNVVDETKPQQAEETQTTENAQEKSIGTHVGDIAPDFIVEDIDGNLIKLSDYRGEKVFLNFWASWCPPCKGEMPDLQELHDEWEKSDQIKMFAINAVDGVSETKESGSKYLADNGYTFFSAYDVSAQESNSATMQYAARGLPTSYIIDEDGVVLWTQIGMTTKQEVQAALKSFPDESSKQ